MTHRQALQLDGFEQRLLAELRAEVDEQSAEAPTAAARRRRQWYVPTAGVAAAALAVAVVVTTSRPTPAYAVSGGNGKAVKVKVNRLEGAPALVAALRERGISADITYLPPDHVCAPGRYTDRSTSGLSLSVGADRFEVKIPAGAVRQGETFVLSAAVRPLVNGVQAAVEFGVATGAVGPCRVVVADPPPPAPDSQ